jgi:hypothetical protein
MTATQLATGTMSTHCEMGGYTDVKFKDAIRYLTQVDYGVALTVSLGLELGLLEYRRVFILRSVSYIRPWNGYWACSGYSCVKIDHAHANGRCWTGKFFWGNLLQWTARGGEMAWHYRHRAHYSCHFLIVARTCTFVLPSQVLIGFGSRV